MNAYTVLELVSNNKMEELKKLAKAEITEKAIKENEGNKELRRYKSAIKYFKKVNNDRLNGTWEENGKQCFTNGYSAFILDNKINGLKEIQKGFDIYKAIGNTENYVEIPVNIKEIKANFKIQKAQSKQKIYYYDIGISRYNIEFIIHCYDILGGDITFKQHVKDELSCAMMESENGICILLPIKKPQEGEHA